MSDCLFCKIRDGQIPARRVHADAEVVVFEDINPQAPTHLLVIPTRHISTTDDLVASDDALVGKMVRVAAEMARQRGVAERGYRLVMNCREGAGQSVFHLHLHLLGGRGFSWPPG